MHPVHCIQPMSACHVARTTISNVFPSHVACTHYGFIGPGVYKILSKTHDMCHWGEQSGYFFGGTVPYTWPWDCRMRVCHIRCTYSPMYIWHTLIRQSHGHVYGTVPWPRVWDRPTQDFIVIGSKIVYPNIYIGKFSPSCTHVRIWLVTHKL